MNDEDYGWRLFAAVVLGVAGIMRIFDSIWAFRYHGYIPENLEKAIFGQSLKTYGWIYMATAAVLIICALAVLHRSQIARWVGVVGAAWAAVSAIWWMPYYPIWSLTYIGLAALVVYALVAHGGRASSSVGSGQA